MRKWWRKCNGEIESSGGGKEAKRKEKNWRKCKACTNKMGRRIVKLWKMMKEV